MHAWHKYGHLIGHASVTGRMSAIECTIMGMDKKVENSKAYTLFRGWEGLEGRQAFWSLRPTKKLGTRSKVGN